jgi:hypothetical protein
MDASHAHPSRKRPGSGSLAAASLTRWTTANPGGVATLAHRSTDAAGGIGIASTDVDAYFMSSSPRPDGPSGATAYRSSLGMERAAGPSRGEKATDEMVRRVPRRIAQCTHAITQ